MSCAVKKCRNIKRLLLPGSKISFHRFPRDSEYFNKWLQAIGRNHENISWKPTLFICSQHFKPDDITVDAKGKQLLKWSAIPLLHLQEAATEKSSFSVEVEIPSTPSQSPVKSKSAEFMQPFPSPKRRKTVTAPHESGSGSKSSSLPSPASHISDIKVSSASDSSASRKRKR